jgi:replication factor C subunit 2/4
LIEPLASRCAKFRFKPLPAKAMKDRMQHIQMSENIAMNEDVMNCVLECANGDMRRAVTLLQSAKQLSGGATTKITKDMVVDIAGKVTLTDTGCSIFVLIGYCIHIPQIPDAVIQRLWTSVSTRNSRFDAIEQTAKDVSLDGYPLAAIIVQLHEIVVGNGSVTDLNKALICEKIAQVL